MTEERSTSGYGCPKCGGLRQWPAGCVIRLPDSECEAKPVDYIGASRFVGDAGFVSADTPVPTRDDFLRRHAAELTAEPEAPAPNPPGFLFDLTIRVGRIQEEGKHVPASTAAALYAKAVYHEMSETVRSAVSITTCALTNVLHDDRGWARLLAEKNERAIVEVRASKMVRQKFAGAMTAMGQSYMFQLRDDVLAVIRALEPPEGAWVADEPEPQGESKMEDAQAGDGVALQSGAHPDVPQLNFDDHAPALAKAAAIVHYPGESDTSLEYRIPTYINDAKQFIAMFNAALALVQQLTQPQNPQPQPNPLNPSTEHNQG